MYDHELFALFSLVTSSTVALQSVLKQSSPAPSSLAPIIASLNAVSATTGHRIFCFEDRHSSQVSVSLSSHA